MRATRKLLVFVLCMLLCTPVSPAQDQQSAAKDRNGASQDLTIIIQQQQVRFIAQQQGDELRLQVFDQTGELVYDSGVVETTEINWPLQTLNGETLKSGLYAYTLSSREVGKPAGAETRLRRGHFIVDRAIDRDGADRLWVTSRNESSVGAELTIARDEFSTIAGASMSNGGGDRYVGQRGGTADRGTDGRKVEGESLSQSKPEKATGKMIAAAAAAGTVGQIAKFTSATEVGNSVMTELNGNIGVGLANPTTKLQVLSETPGVTAIYGESATGRGVWGKSTSSRGVYGESVSNVGVWGVSSSSTGVIGNSTTGYGVQGTSAGPDGFAGHFVNGGGGSGVYAESPTGRAIWGKSASSRGVYGESVSNVGVWGVSSSSTGVIGNSTTGYGVQGTSGGPNGFAGHFANTGGGSGVYSESPTGRAIWGKSVSSRGVYGESDSNVGVWGVSNSSTGVIGVSATGYGVDGNSASASGFGGHFSNTGGGKALKVDGTASVGVLEITNGADFAENFDVSADQRAGGSLVSEIQPGLVVAIDPANPGKLNLSRRAYDRRVAGVISGAGGVKPGMTMGQAQTLADGKYPVALSGRVYVWVDATRGAIHPGDLLTTSATPGHAMKAGVQAKSQGAILGKAMTRLKAGKGLVLVLVTLQ